MNKTLQIIIVAGALFALATGNNAIGATGIVGSGGATGATGGTVCAAATGVVCQPKPTCGATLKATVPAPATAAKASRHAPKRKHRHHH